MLVYSKRHARNENSLKFAQSNYLIIEDNKIISAHLKRQFDKENLQCTISVNCEEAFNKAYHNYYDLILCDINLPDGNGKDLIKKIRANKDCKSHDSKIALLTADESLVNDQELDQLNICEVFSKPVKPKKFFKQLKNIWSHEDIENVSTTGENKIRKNSLAKNLSKLFKDQNTIDEVLEDLIAQLEVSLTTLEISTKLKNYNEVYRISHKVKPSLELLSINTLSECFSNLEKYSKVENFEEIEKWFGQLKNISRHEISNIKEHISG